MGGRLVGFVYGVSTVGNVLGTLITTFVLVPSFGSRALTMVFAGITILCGLLMIASHRFLRGTDA
jgi:cytochrome c biogenesis protein CcdA